MPSEHMEESNQTGSESSADISGSFTVLAASTILGVAHEGRDIESNTVEKRDHDAHDNGEAFFTSGVRDGSAPYQIDDVEDYLSDDDGCSRGDYPLENRWWVVGFPGEVHKKVLGSEEAENHGQDNNKWIPSVPHEHRKHVKVGQK